jgi:predicted nuclease of predicted toxin-antitoxin system
MTKIPKQEIDSEWFEPDDAIYYPSGNPKKKLRLLADTNIPKGGIEEIQKHHIDIVSSAQKGLANREDPEILTKAKKLGRILLTLDPNFWSDRKFPLHSVNGIIFIDIPPSDERNILLSFSFFYTSFAKQQDLSWWPGRKVRATVNDYVIKVRTYQGENIAYEFRLSGKHRLLTRQISFP